jgi:hypothetical protein
MSGKSIARVMLDRWLVTKICEADALKNLCNATRSFLETHECKSHSLFFVAEGRQAGLPGCKVLLQRFFITSASQNAGKSSAADGVDEIKELSAEFR